MKSKLLTLMFLAGSAAFAGPRIFVGVGFGAPAPVAVYAPPPAPVVAPYVPVAPEPGHAWVGGYWQPVGARWNWHAGYWAARPYAHANWVGPRYSAGHYYGGYWRR
jgi:hypothetical protein